MGDLAGSIIEILKWIGPPLYKWIEYHRKLEEYKDTFKRTLDKLISQKDEIELRLKTECEFGKLPKNKVKFWLESTQMIIDDAKSVEQAFREVKYLSRASLAKLVEKKIQQAQTLCEESNSFDSLVIDAPLSKETTAKKNMEEIWRQLMGNEIEKIGIFGMGGVGKTTVMTHVNNRLKEEKKFDHVIWVTVSQTFDLNKVQNEIANALKLHHLSDIENQKQRTGILLRMLKRKRFVLILDDIWKAIRFEEVGIPEPTKENGCKLVITTRSVEVCRQMGCEPIKVMPFSEDEALELFLERAKLDISEFPTLKEIVELVVKQCAGLPLAIVTVASSMKGEYDVLEWRNALKELSDNIRSIKIGMDDEVFARLRFSYDRLNDENIQHCFLYCALYPEDFDIPKNELVDCWITEGFVDEMDNLQAKEDRARIIIKKLINNCLLLESTADRRRRSYVKLHDVVRDMSLKYIASKSPLFMVKAGLKLEKVPDDQEWKENLDKVSLMRNLIREIPSSMSPNCKTLSTLLLQNNPLKSIPESFFSQMHELKILNLSGTQIMSLPNSISELTNLTALLLNGCRLLGHVPSLAKLRSLGELDLGDTNMNEVPAGMEMLANLTSLDLFSYKVDKLPAEMFPKLYRLEKLHVYWGWETPSVAVEEATRLKNLDCLVAQFCNLKDFNCSANSLNSRRYRLIFNPTNISLMWGKLPVHLHGANKQVILERCNICERKEDSICLPKDAEVLHISRCHDVRNICDIPTFNRLERLKILCFERCPKLKKIISTSKLQLDVLKNLEEIDLLHCDEMEEIIALDDGDEEEKSKKELINLPKLTSLVLLAMPKLKSVTNNCGSNGVMVCESLQQVRIWACPQLKRLPFHLPIDEKGQPSPPLALQKLDIDREWWEALEWDHLHPHAKSLLLPFCQFH